MSSEDFKSFIVTNPDLVDEGIDVSGLRTTTDASILGNIPDYGGIQYEAYNPNRLSDLMTLYSTGLPTIPTETAQIPAAVDTLVDTGGGGGMDQATGGLDLGDTTITGGTNLNDYEGMGDMTGGITGDSIEMENLSPIDIGTVDDYDDLKDYENAVAAANISGTISGAPDVFDINETGDPSQNMLDVPTQDVGLAYTGDFDPNDEGTVYSNELENFAPEQQGIIDQAFSKVGSTAENIMDDLSKIPGAVVDFANQTVDIFGKKINVGSTLLKAGINKIVGGPITLVFDALDALGIEGGRGDVSDALGEKYGMDDIGRLTGGPMEGYSVGPDHAQTVQDRIDNIENRTAPQTDASKQKIAELEAYKSEVIATGSSGVITEPGTVVGPGELGTQEIFDEFNQTPTEKADKEAGVDTGDASVAKDIAAADRADTAPPSDPYSGGEGGVQSGMNTPSAPQAATETAAYSNENEYESAAYDAPKSAPYQDAISRGQTGGGSGTGGSTGTHCCTAANERGDMTLLEVKKLRVWHRKQSKIWQKGYDVWGRVMADNLVSKYKWSSDRVRDFYNHKIYGKRTIGSTFADFCIYPMSMVIGCILTVMPPILGYQKQENKNVK